MHDGYFGNGGMLSPIFASAVEISAEQIFYNNEKEHEQEIPSKIENSKDLDSHEMTMESE